MNNSYRLIRVWPDIFLYYLWGGPIIQLVALSYLAPNLHRGNGSISERDWIDFYEMSDMHEPNMAKLSWTYLRLRSDGNNAIVGLLSFLTSFGITRLIKAMRSLRSIVLQRA
jgi:hypothetical protein